MPHLCTPKPKDEKDKQGHVCLAIDICFHTQVLERINMPHGMGDRWRDMVCKTALDMVGKLHELDLDVHDFKTLNTKYFGPSTASEGCSTMAWKPIGAFDKKGDLPSTNAAAKKKAAKAQAAQGKNAAADYGLDPAALGNLKQMDLGPGSGLSGGDGSSGAS